jgi:hypothetical protein
MENQIDNDKLGSLHISDVRQGDHVAELRHVMDWLRRNQDKFQSVPSEPRLLRCSEDEQKQMVEKFEESACKVTDRPDETFDDAAIVFPVQSDFYKFMDFLNKFKWDVCARGPYRNSWECDEDPFEEIQT